MHRRRHLIRYKYDLFLSTEMLWYQSHFVQILAIKQNNPTSFWQITKFNVVLLMYLVLNRLNNAVDLMGRVKLNEGNVFPYKC